MLLKDVLKTSFSGLTTHKSRSALTVLGIVIGITSITLVMAIGQSAEKLILSEVQSMGPANVFIVPGRQPKGMIEGSSSIMNDSIKEKDFRDLQKKSNVPDAMGAAAFVFGPATAVYGSENYHVTLLGSNEEGVNVYDLKLQEGNFFTDEDVSQKSQVVILGGKTAGELFGASSPIGEKIKIKNSMFRIIGVLEKKSQSFVNFDEAILMPYTTAQQYVLGIKYIQRVSVEASSIDTVPNVVEDIKTLLRNNHNITDPDKDDFFIETQADIMKSIGTITTILTALLTSIAAISLVVGGIGIMNIMLVSVTERTREIGLRKAIGATSGDILKQFLAEAVILTLSGGLIGVLFGLILSWGGLAIAGKFTSINFSFSFPVSGVLLGLGVSAVIGLAFGVFPARSAAKKSPIEALRYE